MNRFLVDVFCIIIGIVLGILTIWMIDNKPQINNAIEVQDLHQKTGEYANLNNDVNTLQSARIKLLEGQLSATQDLIKQMSQFDFSTTKALCDRIAKLEAAASNQNPK